MKSSKVRKSAVPTKDTNNDTDNVRSHHISHACDRCRTLRTKCSGDTRCTKCAKDNAKCHYSDRKRERNKKNIEQVGSLQNDKRELLDALRSIVEGPDFSANKHSDLLNLVYKMSFEPSESPASGTTSQSQNQSDTSNRETKGRSPETSRGRNPKDGANDTPYGESLVGSDVGSPDRRRELTVVVDLDQGAGMAGYVGKMSSMNWLDRSCQYLGGMPDPPGSSMTNFMELDSKPVTVPGLTYFMDDEDLLFVNEDYVEPYHLPPWELALVLSEAYFQSLQGSFCFVERNSFYAALSEAYQVARSGSLPPWDKRRYLAMANMMWSVGAKWLQMVDLDQVPASRASSSAIAEHHLTYYARARTLGLDHRMQLDHPSMPLVQGMGVLAFYLTANGSIHRAWNFAGQAIRLAMALGLHLSVSSDALSDLELQHRAQLWFSLFRLDTLLSEVTGRPKSLRGSDITLSVHSLSVREQVESAATLYHSDESLSALSTWKAFLATGQGIEMSSSSSLSFEPGKYVGPSASRTTETHFLTALDLSLISDRVATSLYLSPDDLTWADTQRTAQKLELQLSTWQKNLPSAFQLGSTGDADIDPRFGLGLELYFWSVKMILYRPFLCDISITNQSEVSSDYNIACARRCVVAAIHVIDVLPGNPQVRQIYQILPWWALLHYVCQAAAVLLLEMCLNVQHMEKEAHRITTAMKKALEYLWILSPVSKSASKAWSILRLLVENVGQKYGFHVLENVPQEAERPADWSDADEQILQSALLKIMQ